MLVAAIGVHDEDLVAVVGRPRGLEDEALAVRRPVRLGILPAVSQLFAVAEVLRLRCANPAAATKTNTVFFISGDSVYCGACAACLHS